MFGRVYFEWRVRGSLTKRPLVGSRRALGVGNGVICQLPTHLHEQGGGESDAMEFAERYMYYRIQRASTRKVMENQDDLNDLQGVYGEKAMRKCEDLFPVLYSTSDYRSAHHK